jgi:hypothetical protein
MYRFNPTDIHFVDNPNGLLGLSNSTTFFIYTAAGTTRGMRECIDFLQGFSSPYQKPLNVKFLVEKTTDPDSMDIVQSLCHVCGSTVQSFRHVGSVICSHPGTRYEFTHGPTMLFSSQFNQYIARGQYDLSVMYGRPMSYGTVDDFNGFGSRYSDPGPCTKCSEGLLKMEYINESKDNYCKCDEGKKLRKQQKVGSK